MYAETVRHPMSSSTNYAEIVSFANIAVDDLHNDHRTRRVVDKGARR
jgi:hypothetical protein